MVMADLPEEPRKGSEELPLMASFPPALAVPASWRRAGGTGCPGWENQDHSPEVATVGGVMDVAAQTREHLLNITAVSCIKDLEHRGTEGKFQSPRLEAQEARGELLGQLRRASLSFC